MAATVSTSLAGVEETAAHSISTLLLILFTFLVSYLLLYPNIKLFTFC